MYRMLSLVSNVFFLLRMYWENGHTSLTHTCWGIPHSLNTFYKRKHYQREHILSERTHSIERKHLLYRTHLLRDTLSDDDDEGNLIFNGVNGRSHGEGWRHVDHRRVRLHCVCITYRSRTTDQHCVFFTYHHGVSFHMHTVFETQYITYRSRTTYELVVFITYQHCVGITYRSRTATESKTICSISKKLH